MGLNLEENYKYRKLALTILAKALDDICPTFEEEPTDVRSIFYKERTALFRKQERELDKEWQELEKEAINEVKAFNVARNSITQKIMRTNKHDRIQKKVKELEKTLTARLKYLTNKEKAYLKSIDSQLKVLEKDSKLYNQLTKNRLKFTKSTSLKIKKSIERYNKIITNVKNSDNSEKVKERLKHSSLVWDKKYNKLKSKFNEKQIIIENKRFELDQIRLAIQSFEEEKDIIQHWCTLAGVTLLQCYTAVNFRMSLINRQSEKINQIINDIKNIGEQNLL